MNVKLFSPDMLDALTKEASAAPRKRKHLNIHQSYDDGCQRLLNAIAPESYIHPHRHALDPKTETLVAIRGEFGLVEFVESGAVKRTVRFGTERYAATATAVGVELAPSVWHTVLALTPDAVLLEMKAGPFDPAAAKEFATWAPAEGSLEASAYHRALRALFTASVTANPFLRQAIAEQAVV